MCLYYIIANLSNNVSLVMIPNELNKLDINGHTYFSVNRLTISQQLKNNIWPNKDVSFHKMVNLRLR